MIIAVMVIFITIFYLLDQHVCENFDVFTVSEATTIKILPKKIFMYWNEVNITNRFVKRNVDNLKKIIGNHYTLFIFNEENIREEIGDLINIKEKISHQHFADFVRLFLLRKYGGMWIDASLVIFDKKFVDDIYEIFDNNRFDVFLYEYKGYQDELEKKYLENRLIVAPENSIFIMDMYDAYTKALNMGFFVYKTQLLLNGVSFNNIFSNLFDTYLMQHAIIRYLLKTKKDLYKVEVQHASDKLFKIHDLNEWDNEKVSNDMMNKEKLKKYDITAIKLVANNRNHFNKNNLSDKFFDMLEKNN
jgi:hypothetical protein